MKAVPNLWAPIREYAKFLTETGDLITIPLEKQYTTIYFYFFCVYFFLTYWKGGRN
jgi:hypothetical protein